jgi:hypothetical protein
LPINGGGYHIVVSKVVIELNSGAANLPLDMHVAWAGEIKRDGLEDVCPGGMLYAPSGNNWDVLLLTGITAGRGAR